jgi:hypothetical protein
MYSRVTQLEVDTLRVDVGEALATFEQDVVPLLREQEGYEGSYVLMNAEGKALLITFWDTEAAAQATPFYTEQIAQYVTLFRAPPGRETYEVGFADTPLIAV